MQSSERSVSLWEATRPQRARTPLSGEADADVCVVGAGVAGMTTAYLLAKAGRRVVVLEKDAVGAGETGQTTAHLSSALDDYYHVLEEVHGHGGARLAYQSHHAAIGTMERIAADEGIDCDFARVDGYWFLRPEDGVSLLERERDAARRAGADAELVDRIPGVPFDSGPALRFAGQGQLHALRYLEGLADAFERLGGRIHTGARVTEFEGGARTRAAGEGFAVTAGALVVATNPPAHLMFPIHTKQAPYRTFAIAVRVPASAAPPILLWDTGDPYHYVRTQPVDGDPAHRWLIVGGEDVKQAHADDAAERFSRLEAWTRERFPSAGAAAHRWSGMVMEPADYLAFIGRDPRGAENVYLATGDSGHGWTHGTIAGMLISDLVLDRENPWTSLYDPSRRTLALDAVKEFVRESIDVAVQYTRLAPTGGDVKSEDDVPPGTGAVVQDGMKKVAVYRDEGGRVHRMSALCTHLQCVVRWNTEERSWDCPCHGSRFGPTGEVLTGPAIFPLGAAQEEGA